MTFSAFETSVEGGQPVELYILTVGATTYRWNNSEDTLTIDGNDYTPLSIERSKIVQGPEDRNQTVTFTVPGTIPFVTPYINSVPAAQAVMTVRKLHRPDFPGPEVVTIYRGIVKAVNFDDENGRKSEIATQPFVSGLNRPIPRFVYKGLCNNTLYDDFCQVDDTDPAYRASLDVTAVSGNTLTIPGLDSFGDGWFDGGLIETSGQGDARMILNQVGNVVTLHLPFSQGVLNETVTILAGCAHTIAVCKSKFDNVINFGGFAFVPTLNPFESGIDPAVCS